MKEVVIAGYLRTAQPRSRPNDPARDWFCKMRGDELLAKLQTAVETAVRRNLIGHENAGHFLKLYEEGLRGYTYLA